MPLSKGPPKIRVVQPRLTGNPAAAREWIEANRSTLEDLFQEQDIAPFERQFEDYIVERAVGSAFEELGRLAPAAIRNLPPRLTRFLVSILGAEFRIDTMGLLSVWRRSSATTRAMVLEELVLEYFFVFQHLTKDRDSEFACELYRVVGRRLDSFLEAGEERGGIRRGQELSEALIRSYVRRFRSLETTARIKKTRYDPQIHRKVLIGWRDGSTLPIQDPDVGAVYRSDIGGQVETIRPESNFSVISPEKGGLDGDLAVALDAAGLVGNGVVSTVFLLALQKMSEAHARAYVYCHVYSTMTKKEVHETFFGEEISFTGFRTRVCRGERQLLQKMEDEIETVRELVRRTEHEEAVNTALDDLQRRIVWYREETLGTRRKRMGRRG